VRARTAVALAAAGAGAAALTSAAVRAERRALAAEDPCGPDVLALPDGEHVKVETDDGAVLSVVVAGPHGADTVVLSHCWTGSRGVWAPVARRLVERGRRVVLYDQRGHGESTVGRDGCTIDRIALDLRDVLNAVDASDAVLVGHSMGGMTVQAFASQHPDVADRRVRSIVLVATAASGLGVRGAASLAAAAIASPVLERIMRTGRGHWFVRNTLGRDVRHAHLTATRDLFVATPADVRRDFLVAMQAMDLRPGLSAVSAPATVVIGTRDRLTPPRLGRELASTLPSAELVELPDRGHMLPFEAPDELADLIAQQHERS
jgi:pimeloyl-ACP methyl ester carboxylesterase